VLNRYPPTFCFVWADGVSPKVVLKFFLWLSTFIKYIGIVAAGSLVALYLYPFLLPWKCSFGRSFSADEVLQLLNQFFNLEMLVIVLENNLKFISN
jgi:hypothetical protein